MARLRVAAHAGEGCLVRRLLRRRLRERTSRLATTHTYICIVAIPACAHRLVRGFAGSFDFSDRAPPHPNPTPPQLLYQLKERVDLVWTQYELAYAEEKRRNPATPPLWKGWYVRRPLADSTETWPTESLPRRCRSAIRSPPAERFALALRIRRSTGASSSRRRGSRTLRGGNT